MTDWDVFRSACLALLSGQNPYMVGQGEMRFFNPAWTLVPLLPFTLIPPLPGLLINAFLSMAVLLLVTHRMGLSKWEFFWMAICPMHLQSMIYGNIEWLPLVGLLLPGPLAMIFFTTKPQSTIGWILLTLLNQWKSNRWKGVLLTLLPTAVLGILTYILWGLPPIPGPLNPGQRSLFPFSLILGLPALWLTLRNRDERLAGFVGPFISPYVTFHGYFPALFPFKGKWMALAVILSFIPVLLSIVA